MKLCVDCRHHRTSNPIGIYHYCDYKTTFKPSPVTGERIPVGARTCEYERDIDAENRCGPEGKFWEAKP